MANKPMGAPFVALVLIGSLVLAVGITKATGYWRTESSKDPAQIGEGDFAGMPDPGDIRGSYSFADIEDAFGVPPSVMAEAFSMTEGDPGAVLAKDLEKVWEGAAGEWEVGTDAVRLFTALWTGLPHTPETTTALPKAAIEILLEEGKIDPSQAASINTVGNGTAAPPPSTVEAADNSHDEVPQDRTVRGMTSFGDLREWGVTEEAWTELFGASMGQDEELLKEWLEAAGFSMSGSKTDIQELVDEAENPST